ncbi:MAG: DUF1015 family protein [Bacteroidia bacterium]|nr:DUF1015 family protein [Bacteroidia bacterium]MBT8279130.1 DUF1015 family protein [Bacteroidia bacterium]NND26252.1 DUF1015 domain-containing protein [Flavobacteriaceae bacterium]NNK61072.1 DUF1015 domain-containing protein [Flavobacteriaceae bacterium]NNL33305.1 DUF1015 domain-containing protein [Flavobacteriaceae bacterium]
MSVFVPFKAFRPSPNFVEEVACKPYDVLNAAEAKSEAEGKPNSFYHVIKPEIDFSNDHDPYAPEIYKKGKANFDALVNKKVLIQDETASFYVYELTMDGHVQTGLVGCCSIDDYFNNVIKKHELTRPDKEEDRKNHVRASKLNYEPVFLSYPNVSDIDALVDSMKNEDSVYDFVADDGIRHRLWPVTDAQKLNELESLFESKVDSIYIADGHHRTAAGSLVAKELRDARNGSSGDGHRDNYVMAVVFPDNQLKILDYNRVIKDLNGLTEDELLKAVGDKFDIEKKAEAYRPEGPHTFGMYLNKQWYKLTSKAGTYNDNDPIGQLDVTILSENILEPLFNIVDLRKDKRIDFVGGMRGLGELERRVDHGNMEVAFSVHPVSMDQLITISDNDLIMPPKVTWFEPKLRSGLFVHDLNA